MPVAYATVEPLSAAFILLRCLVYHPVCASKEGGHFLYGAATPPVQEGKFARRHISSSSPGSMRVSQQFSRARLLVPQRDDRAYAACAVCRDVTCEQRHDHDNCRGCSERDGIHRLNLKQERGQNACEQDREQKSQRDSGGRHSQALRQYHPKDRPLLRSNRKANAELRSSP